MTADLTQAPPAVTCHKCAYDLRAQPTAGVCPECGTSVAESIQVAKLPRRPAWRDSDPRWRRRMLAGVWILTLVFIVEMVIAAVGPESIPVPSPSFIYGVVGSLKETLARDFRLSAILMVSVGLVLLFSRERGRRRSRLDWTRRWGVVGSYVILLANTASIFFIAAMVLTGIAALFQSIALRYQPPVTAFFVALGPNLLLYGPQAKDSKIHVVAVVAAALTVLFACVPLYNALRSTLPRTYPRLRFLAAVPPGCLALFAILNLLALAAEALNQAKPKPGPFGVGSVSSLDIYALSNALYFRPDSLASALHVRGPSATVTLDLLPETVKASALALTALWLTAAQLATYRRRIPPPPAPRPPNDSPRPPG